MRLIRLMFVPLLLTACQPPAVPTPSDHVTPSPPPPTPTPCSTTMMLASWPLPRLIAQTIVVPVDETQVGTVQPEVASGAGGVILFGSAAPADLAAQLRTLTASAPGGIAPFVMTDEEGGAVQRMANLVGDVPSARFMAETMSAAQITTLAANAGAAMRQAGVTMDLAPVLDLDSGAGPDNSDADGTRSFSADPAIATADGLAFAAGLEQAGVTPVLKHFPGLGGATGNTDVSPAATLPWSMLQTGGLQPFITAINQGFPAVMVSNATVPGLTSEPASLSESVITGELRQALHFNGLVMTDSLSAAALAQSGYSVPQAVVDALEAGADIVLFSADAAHVASETAAIVAAVGDAVQRGSLPESVLVDAVAHILTAKHVDLCA